MLLYLLLLHIFTTCDIISMILGFINSFSLENSYLASCWGLYVHYDNVGKRIKYLYLYILVCYFYVALLLHYR